MANSSHGLIFYSTALCNPGSCSDLKEVVLSQASLLIKASHSGSRVLCAEARCRLDATGGICLRPPAAEACA